MNVLLLHQITYWLNGVAIVVFLGMEIFWFVKQGKALGNIPSLVAGFFIYNLPFLLLALSMYFQSVPELWAVVVRLLVVLICIPFNLWLHYHGDKGGNSVGMAIVFFLLVSVPLVVIMEIIFAFYN